VGVSDGNQKFLVALKVGQGMATKIFDCHLTHLQSPMVTEILVAIKGATKIFWLPYLVPPLG
jgi:hypothetical protein